MPIDYRIDHDRRLVLATAHGEIGEDDLLTYQKTVWSDPTHAGYGELVDMSGVAAIKTPSVAGMRNLAALSASMDTPGRASRFAIVAPGDLAFGLGRMYQSYRELKADTRKKVAVFRTRDEALDWLAGAGREQDG